MKEKKKHIIKPILLKQKLKQHHFPNLIIIKNRKKIIIIQNLVIEGLKAIGYKTSKEYFAEMEKKHPIL